MYRYHGRHARRSAARTRLARSSAVLPAAALLLPAIHPGAHQVIKPDTTHSASLPAAFGGRGIPRARQVAVLAAHRDTQSYTVASGDSLSRLARRFYHHASWWPRIWWANRHKISNPNMITAGATFVIPAPHAPRASTVRGALRAIPAPPPPPAAQAAPVQAQPVSQPVAAQPVSANVSTSGMGSFQACVIARESGGNPAAVNPSSGAGGLYQFLPSTWAALGFSGLPENASVATQNAAFARAYAQSGTAPWAPYDGC